jgi:AAA ATPase-like protein
MMEVGELGKTPERLTALVGDVTVQAIALQEQAEPGVIYCSEATAHLVQERMYLTPVEFTPLTGPWLLGRTYRLNGVERRRTPRGQPQGRILSPFVGREREMATLHALLAQVEAGRGQVGGIVGEAGIGKSRLISEFCHSLQGRTLMYLTGRCFSYGSATTVPSAAGPLATPLWHHGGRRS